ncbi:MAG: hypothetical protein NTZ72_14025 [Afipia sp.]|nr:hypothetical protein [Afipia sp.]
MVRPTKLKYILALSFLSISSTLAAAKCEHPPIPWSFGRDAIRSAWRITDGSACSTRMNHPEHIAGIEIENKPKNGIAGRDGPYGVAYQPNNGFKGTDDFSFKVISNSRYRKGAGWVGRVHVRVISE